MKQITKFSIFAAFLLSGCTTTAIATSAITTGVAASCKFIPSLLTVNAVTARLPVLPNPDEYNKSIVRYICDAVSQYALQPESGGGNADGTIRFEADGIPFEGKIVK